MEYLWIILNAWFLIQDTDISGEGMNHIDFCLKEYHVRNPLLLNRLVSCAEILGQTNY